MHRKAIFLAFFVCLFFYCRPALSMAQTTAQDPINIPAASAILMEGKTSKILYQKDPDRKLPIASMAKMMTEYLILEAIKDGKITWETNTGISDYAWRISQNLQLSNVPLRREVQYSVRELYEATAVYSANGATIALAELVAGSETDFVRLMNDKAKKWGLANSTFVNSTGLNNRSLLGRHPAGTDPDAESSMSAGDLATLAYRLLRDHPEVLATSRIPRKIFRANTQDAIRMDNWNWMLPELVYGYEGMDGLKTGYTTRAGYCFTGTAEREDIRLISVVMRTDSYHTRFAETKKLMDYGFGNFKKTKLAPAGFDENGRLALPVANGRKETVPVAPAGTLEILLRAGDKFTAVFQPVHPGLAKNGTLTAPLKEGEIVGYLLPLSTGDNDYEYLTAEGREEDRVPVLTTEAVPRAGWFTIIIRSIRDFLRATWRRVLDFFSFIPNLRPGKKPSDTGPVFINPTAGPLFCLHRPV